MLVEIAIRTDSSAEIGTGHVARCLTLARQLRDQGALVHFFCRDLPGNTSAQIEAAGFSLERLAQPSGEFHDPGAPSHGSWLGVHWRQDAEEVRLRLASLGLRPDWLIVDAYALDARWEESLRPHVGSIMAIDDLADRQHACDLLLDQNFYRRYGRYRTRVSSGCRVLEGPQFALLRPEFAECRRHVRHRDGQVRRVVVFFGGVDLLNETAKALRALASLRRNDISVDVILGPANPHAGTIESFCSSRRNVHVHLNVTDVARVMADADLAIGAGGMNTWERCCLGVPSIVISVAANQQGTTEELALDARHIHAGKSAEVTDERLLAIVQVLLELPLTLQAISRRAMELTDGRGAERVTSALLAQNGSVVPRATQVHSEKP